MTDRGKYYLTTAIAYTSGKPHIGNSYEIVMADAICRSKRQNEQNHQQLKSHLRRYQSRQSQRRRARSDPGRSS